MRKRFLLYLSLTLIVGSSFRVDTNAKLKATYIYNFAINTNWPKHKKSGEFIIGVLGDNESLLNSLKIVEGRKIGSQTARVKKYTSVDDCSLANIVYISNNLYPQLSSISQQLLNKNILIIVEGNKLIKPQKTCINLYPINNKWVFDINEKVLIGQQLQVTAKLKTLANDIF